MEGGKDEHGGGMRGRGRREKEEGEEGKKRKGKERWHEIKKGQRRYCNSDKIYFFLSLSPFVPLSPCFISILFSS